MPLVITPEEIVIQDEGASQGNANIVNFVGAGVTATVAGDTATVTISGSAGGGVSIGQLLTTGRLNFLS